jgi:anhydro-N-acetylmuramic acid kinase
MKQNEYYIIGQMSGTSLDGVDLVHVRIGFKEKYYFELLNFETISYSSQWKQKLINGFNKTGSSLKKLDSDYGNLLAGFILEFIKRNKIDKVDFIASHGHTIFHKPEKGFTLQIGNGPEIFNLTNVKTICDFRVQDVKLGGQGAPLVPIGDKLLFSEYDNCLNLGGFANISTEINNERIAYDICPANIVLNYYVGKLGLEFDDKGKLASQGNVHKELLAALNQLEFYELQPPKSLGFEFIESTILPMINKYQLQISDILRTYVEHTAIQISKVLNRKKGKCLVTGGGAFNDFLMDRMRVLTTLELIIPSKKIINYKEALVFAFLGYLKNLNEINCLKSVTGASKDHSSGVIYN